MPPWWLRIQGQVTKQASKQLFPSSLDQFVSPGSHLELLPWTPWVMDRHWEVQGEINPFLLKLCCLTVFSDQQKIYDCQHVIPMYSFHDILGRQRGVYLFLSSIHQEVGAEFVYISPVPCSENPAPISFPAAQKNREIGHELFRAERSSVFSYMKYNFGASVADTATQVVGDMSFHFPPVYRLSVPRIDPSQLIVCHPADWPCRFSDTFLINFVFLASLEIQSCHLPFFCSVK